MKNFLKYFFGFHFISILGVLVGMFLYYAQSETNPLSSFLTSPNLYVICIFTVFVIHFILWIFIDKSTIFNLKHRILNMIGDYFFLVFTTLGTVGSLFLLNTFVL